MRAVGPATRGLIRTGTRHAPATARRYAVSHRTSGAQPDSAPRITSGSLASTEAAAHSATGAWAPAAPDGPVAGHSRCRWANLARSYPWWTLSIPRHTLASSAEPAIGRLASGRGVLLGNRCSKSCRISSSPTLTVSSATALVGSAIIDVASSGAPSAGRPLGAGRSSSPSPSAPQPWSAHLRHDHTLAPPLVAKLARVTIRRFAHEDERRVRDDEEARPGRGGCIGSRHTISSQLGRWPGRTVSRRSVAPRVPGSASGRPPRLPALTRNPTHISACRADEIEANSPSGPRPHGPPRAALEAFGPVSSSNRHASAA
eukprot:scaffold216442_cov31-Tisochrysis_lutea.AAC.1